MVFGVRVYGGLRVAARGRADSVMMKLSGYFQAYHAQIGKRWNETGVLTSVCVCVPSFSL